MTVTEHELKQMESYDGFVHISLQVMLSFHVLNAHYFVFIRAISTQIISTI